MRTCHSKSSSNPLHLSATVLSWLAKCPLARYIVLNTAGSLSYTTPLTVEEARERHDGFLESIQEAFNIAITGKTSFIKTSAEKLCLTLYAGEQCYNICGCLDAVYLLYGRGFEHPVILVLEATISPSVKHLILGEMLFYTLATYMSYGCSVYGLVVNPKHVYLVAYKANAFKHLRILLSPPSYEKALETAEKLRAKKPWICSLCDLKHMCPLGAET